MKKEKVRLTLQEKQLLRKKKEKRFSIIAFIVVGLLLLSFPVILVIGILRSERGPAFSAEQLYGCWYDEDDTSCWRFDDTADGTDVYFFVRTKTTTPFDFSSYTDVILDEEQGTVTVYFGKNQPVTFNCSLKKDRLVLQNEDSKLVFNKGIPISDRNKEIAATYPSVLESPENSSS